MRPWALRRTPALIAAALMIGGCAGSPDTKTTPTPSTSNVPLGQPVTTSAVASISQLLDQWSDGRLPAQEQPKTAQQLLLIEGPDHCSAADTLWALTPQADPNSRLRPSGYYRDTAGTLNNYLKPGSKLFAATISLPARAVYVGTMAGLAELWLDPSDLQTNGYVVNASDRSDVERWTALASLCA